MAAGAEDARAVVERFLADSREPAVLEPGEEPLPLQPGAFSLEVRAGRLTLQAWEKPSLASSNSESSGSVSARASFS